MSNFEDLSKLLFTPGSAPLLIVLGLFLLAGLFIFIERVLYYRRAQVDTLELLRGLTNQLRNHLVKEAITNCDARSGPVGEIFRTAIEHWQDGEAGIRYAIEEMAQILQQRLQFGLRLLAMLANCSSVLGLLGTVFGLVNAFLTISGNEFAGAKELSLSVSSYLVCTAFGLLVSLVCQLFHGVLSCMLDRQLHEMSKGAAEITFFLTHNPPPGNA
ncbi:MAG: MotA/TolQ/ExbB proton channel family protein [Victivallales bacterium]|jgi:biopolymer transport protein ExbB|nr:MotA/TolQ/ExbB proton channel family protein [Victivallales bacterium]